MDNRNRVSKELSLNDAQKQFLWEKFDQGYTAKQLSERYILHPEVVERTLKERNNAAQC